MNKIYLTSLVALFLSFSAYAHKHEGKHGWDGAGISMKMASELNLTTAQKTKLDGIRQANAAQVEALKARKHAVKEKMKAALLADNEDQIRSAYQEKQAVMNEFQQLKLTSMLEARKVLTADQRKKMVSLKEAHEDERED